MADYTELKRLADDLNSAIEKAEHKPGQWSETAQSMGGICEPIEKFQIGKLWAKEEPWAHFSFKRDSWLAVAAVNALPKLLALIAENERVKARLCVCRDCGGQGEIYSGHSSYQGHNQPPEPDMDVCGTCGGDGVLGPLEDFESLAAERDQLKADNEALRKDAERYEWICANACDLNFYAAGPAPIRGRVEIDVEQYPVSELGSAKSELDSIIDAAMGKGEQS